MDTSDKQEKERKKKVNSLLKELKTKDEKTLKKVVISLKQYGDSSILEPLLERWNEGVSNEVETEIQNLFNDIKSNDSSQPIMEGIRNPKYEKIKKALLNSVWNTKVDYSEYLVDFVDIAVKGDFMEALECLTIIENLEGPFEEQQFLEAQVSLSEFAELNDKSSQKAHIISEIASIIKDLEANLIDF